MSIITRTYPAHNENYLVTTNYVVTTDCMNPDINIRKGVRDGFFVIDRELYDRGFYEKEGIGWVNVFKAG